MTMGFPNRALRGGHWLLAGVLLGLLLGCDGFEPAALLPRTADAEIGTPSASSGDVARRGDVATDRATAANPDRPRDPDMESIGPQDTQRVYYQFVDDRGRVQFVERLSDVPAAWRDRVGYVEMSQPPPLSPLEARRSWQLSAGRTAEILQASATTSTRSGAGAGSAAEVLLYSATWCGYCTKARAHLDRNGIDYEIRDVDNPANAQELREKTGRGGIPVLDFSGEILRGYRPERYDEAIRSIRG